MKKAGPQQELPLGCKGRGGHREGAGRPKKRGRNRVPHRARPVVKARYPIHVTKRVLPEVAGLRRWRLCKVLREAFFRTCKKDGFRICHFSIQGNHVHMICEAKSARHLARGIQGWSVSVARRLNGARGRKGTVFAERYSMKLVTSPRQARNTLCYVLQNARRHGVKIAPTWGGVDPFSSAWYFDGWADDAWRERVTPSREGPPVAEPESWLLREGWKRWGLIGVTEVPPAGLT